MVFRNDDYNSSIMRDSKNNKPKKKRVPKKVYGRDNPNWEGPESANDNAGDIMTVLEADYSGMAIDFSKATDKAAEAYLDGDQEAFVQNTEAASRAWRAYKERTELVEELQQNGVSQEWKDKYLEFREKNGLPGSATNPTVVTPENELGGTYGGTEYSEEDLQETVSAINEASIEARAVREIPQQYKDNYDNLTSSGSLADVVQDPGGTDRFNEAPTTQMPPINVDDNESGGKSSSYDDLDEYHTPEYLQSLENEQKQDPGGVSASNMNSDTVTMPIGNNSSQTGNEDSNQSSGYRWNSPEESGWNDNKQSSGNNSESKEPPDTESSGSGKGGDGDKKKDKDDDKPKSRKEPGVLTSFEEKTGLDKNGSLRVTWRPTIAGFTFNVGRKGLQSISYGIGNTRSLTGFRYRVWSRDRGTGMSSINLPGGMSYRYKDKKQKKILDESEHLYDEEGHNPRDRVGDQTEGITAMPRKLFNRILGRK